MGWASWGWGATFIDIDNDSDLDLICTNGQLTNLEQFVDDYTVLWENVRGDGVNMVERSTELGIVDNGAGKSAFTLDYDLDGDLDVVISQTGPSLILYENRYDGNNNYLRIKIEGHQTNYFGLGTQISVYMNNLNEIPLYQEMGSIAHWLGHGEYIAHFGLGSGSNNVARVEVYFPVSRKTVSFDNVPRNSFVLITENGNITYYDDDSESFEN